MQLNSSTILRFLGVFLLTAICCMAQTSSFGRSAQGVAIEMIAIGQWVAIALAVVTGIRLMAGGHHGILDIVGFVVGALFALGAQPLMNWMMQRAG